jgi:hypothetical protein
VACCYSWVLLVGLALPHAGWAQGVMVGLRGWGGVDLEGSTVYGGQIEVTDLGASHSVELAVAGIGATRLGEEYGVRHGEVSFPYREDTRVRSVAVTANLLIRHGSGVRGPYLVLGLGLGPQWVDWRLETEYNRLGTPLPGGGSFLEEERMVLGTLLSAGVGLRIHRHLDVRGQVLTMLVPSTKLREDLKLMPVFVLTTGVAF